MAPEFRFLEEQLGLYSNQSQKVEGWQTAHLEAMECRSIEDMINLGLSILQNLRRHTAQWAGDVESGGAIFSWDVAQQFAKWYHWWHQRSAILREVIEDFERRGFQVQSSQEFREAFREVSLMSLDMERVKDSIASLEQGRGAPFKQALDELRNHLR